MCVRKNTLIRHPEVKHIAWVSNNKEETSKPQDSMHKHTAREHNSATNQRTRCPHAMHQTSTLPAKGAQDKQEASRKQQERGRTKGMANTPCAHGNHADAQEEHTSHRNKMGYTQHVHKTARTHAGPPVRTQQQGTRTRHSSIRQCTPPRADGESARTHKECIIHMKQEQHSPLITRVVTKRNHTTKKAIATHTQT